MKWDLLWLHKALKAGERKKLFVKLPTLRFLCAKKNFAAGKKKTVLPLRKRRFKGSQRFSLRVTSCASFSLCEKKPSGEKKRTSKNLSVLQNKKDHLPQGGLYFFLLRLKVSLHNAVQHIAIGKLITHSYCRYPEPHFLSAFQAFDRDLPGST
jgi:hypothetical protein